MLSYCARTPLEPNFTSGTSAETISPSRSAPKHDPARERTPHLVEEKSQEAGVEVTVQEAVQQAPSSRDPTPSPRSPVYPVSPHSSDSSLHLQGERGEERTPGARPTGTRPYRPADFGDEYMQGLLEDRRAMLRESRLRTRHMRSGYLSLEKALNRMRQDFRRHSQRMEACMTAIQIEIQQHREDMAEVVSSLIQRQADTSSTTLTMPSRPLSHPLAGEPSGAQSRGQRMTRSTYKT